MQRDFEWAGAALALAALLGGCDWVRPVFTTAADTAPQGPFIAPRYSLQPVRLPESYTIDRLRGPYEVVERLEMEAGNVWPVEEAPRATLANPEAALRGVPAYNPGAAVRGGYLEQGERPPRDLELRDPLLRDPSPGSDTPLSNEQHAPPSELRPPPRRRGASSPPPPPLPQPESYRLGAPPVTPPTPGLEVYPPPPLNRGEVIIPPDGRPVVTTGGTDRVQGYTSPGVGSGVVHQNNGVTTIAPSGGVPQTFPTRR